MPVFIMTVSGEDRESKPVHSGQTSVVGDTRTASVGLETTKLS